MNLDVLNLDGVNLDGMNLELRWIFYFNVCCEFPVKNWGLYINSSMSSQTMNLLDVVNYEGVNLDGVNLSLKQTI